MNKKKIVKEIFSECPMVRDYKFSVNEYGDFNFKTEKDGIKKMFKIQNVYDTYLRIAFLTNVRGTEYATDLVDKSICSIEPGWGCVYKNEEEFRAIVLEAKRIFEEHGEEIFHKLSIPPEDNSTPEMEKELYENRERLKKDGIQLLGIEGSVGLEQQLRMIVEKVKELHDKPFQEVISDLILLSAVYGSIYCEVSDGEWKFDGVMVSVIKKRPPLSVSPLKEMIYTWKFPENQNITVSCALALHELVRWKNYFT